MSRWFSHIWSHRINDVLGKTDHFKTITDANVNVTSMLAPTIFL